MRSALFAVTCGALLVHPNSSAAQDRVRINFSGGQQATTSQFSQSGAFSEFLESATFTARDTVKRDVFYDAGVTVQFWRHLATGVTVSYFARPNSPTVDARIPHPFYFDQPRLISGRGGGLKRSETAAHIVIAWIVPTTDRVDLTFSAGPSIFHMRQDIVDRVTYAESYPYDEAHFTGVSKQQIKDRAVGYHAGADMTWRLVRRFGIGATLRYAQATVHAPVGGDEITFDVGGLHAGGGVRLIF